MSATPEAFTELGLRLGVVVGIWLAAGLVVIGLVLLASWALNRNRRDFFDSGFTFSGALVAGLGVVIGVCVAAPLLWVQPHHYRLYQVEGEVTSVSNVLTESSGDFTRTPVLTLDTVDRPVTVDDPRAINYEGLHVSMVCTINWRYQAADRYEWDLQQVITERNRP